MSKSVSALVAAASEKFQTLTANDLAAPECQMDVLGDVYIDHLAGAGAAARRKAQSYLLRVKQLLREHGVSLAGPACENLAMLALVEDNPVLADWVATSYDEIFTRDQRLATIREAVEFLADGERSGVYKRFGRWQFAYQVLLDEAPPSYQDGIWNLASDLLEGLVWESGNQIPIAIEQIGAEESEFVAWLIGYACGVEDERTRGRYVQALMLALVSAGLASHIEAVLREGPEAQRGLCVRQLQDCVYDWPEPDLIQQIENTGELAGDRDLEEWQGRVNGMAMRREAELLHRLTGEVPPQVAAQQALAQLRSHLESSEPDPEALDRLDEALRPEE